MMLYSNWSFCIVCIFIYHNHIFHLFIMFLRSWVCYFAEVGLLKMGVMSRQVLPVCSICCVCCPSLRARSRHPVKRYKQLLADIFPRSQVLLTRISTLIIGYRNLCTCVWNCVFKTHNHESASVWQTMWNSICKTQSRTHSKTRTDDCYAIFCHLVLWIMPLCPLLNLHSVTTEKFNNLNL